jgi:endonuclease/exonuclease/phosphatase family metal-dependent hydrolase
VKLISWNIQWCRGVDGVVDPLRIAREARALADPDVCCFQEVADNFDTLEGSRGENQVELLQRAFAGYSAHFAWAVDLPDGKGGRRRFGNLILSRLPVQRVLRHSLPWRPEDGKPSMPRVAIEAVIEGVSITTTHLEYYSREIRAAQVQRLLDLESERQAHAKASPSKDKGGPFEHLPRPSASLLCGDFNMKPEDPLIAKLRETYADAWQAAHPGEPHPVTMCLWEPCSNGPHCCDFVFLSKDLKPRLRSMHVDQKSKASDHQPIVVEIA